MKHDMDAIAARIAELETIEMSDVRRDLEMRRVIMRSQHTPTEFLLTHGRDYPFDLTSFEGPRAEPKNCYGNATHLAHENHDMTYVEGKVWVHGIGIDHAWCVDPSGKVIDPTLVVEDGDDMSRLHGYFGIPFKTRYVTKATLWNKVYGLLDYYAASKTAPKLYELGLEAGQQWVLDNKAPPRKKRRK